MTHALNLNGYDAAAHSAPPQTRKPTIAETRKLLLRVASAEEPSLTLDAHIACWSQGFTMQASSNPETGLFKFFDAKAVSHDCGAWPLFTSDLSRVLGLVNEFAPDLALGMLRYGSGKWSVAWSNDGAPNFADAEFDERFLPMAVLACLLEALVEREARKQ